MPPMTAPGFRTSWAKAWASLPKAATRSDSMGLPCTSSQSRASAVSSTRSATRRLIGVAPGGGLARVTRFPSGSRPATAQRS
jgi:hypothetical protein